jgi:catechol 1,2-dioxygenase
MNHQAIDTLLKTINDSATSEGNPRTKAIVNRVMRDLFYTIEDLDVQPDEFWTALNYLDEAGKSDVAREFRIP